MNVVFYIDEERRWPFAQGNVTHMLTYYEQLQQDFHIEIVANGKAVRQLREKAAKQLEYKAVFCDLIKRGAIIATCHNAMKEQRTEKQELLNDVAAIASDVVEPTVKQQTRYSYIKP